MIAPEHGYDRWPREVLLWPYDGAWPREYEAMHANLKTALGDTLVACHHIGSTAISGMPAKPIIDILAEVDVERLGDACLADMLALGFIDMGAFGIAGRRFFVRTEHGMRTHHLHCFPSGHAEIARHLAFRNYLRMHPETALAYASMKEAAAEQYPYDTSAYTDAKAEFIRSVDEVATLTIGSD